MRALVSGAACAVLLATVASAQVPPPMSMGSCGGQAAITFTNVRLPLAVLADGKRLAAGTYDVRVTTDRPSPAVGQSAAGECWVEFLDKASIAGREIASVVPASEIAAVAKGPAPRPETARVDPLKGGDYLRIWMNHGGTHYVVNLPVAKEQ